MTLTAKEYAVLDREDKRAMKLRTRLLTIDDSFKLRGACRGADATLFFGRFAGRARANAAAEAKKICSGCGVKKECLEYAIVTEAPLDIWGGMTGEERKEIIAQRKTTTKPG